MSDDDSFDEEEYGLKKAIDVQLPADFDPSKVPQTGEEYLHHVIYERTKCKTWVTANIDRSKFVQNQTINYQQEITSDRTPAKLIPTQQWQEKSVQNFLEYQKFVQFKAKGTQPSISTIDQNHLLKTIETTAPKFSECIRYTQAVNLVILQMIAKLFDKDQSDETTQNLHLWAWAVLSLLEKPLSPDQCYILRDFCKKCRQMRARLDENASPQLYKPFNLYICIIARVYNQLDLQD